LGIVPEREPLGAALLRAWRGSLKIRIMAITGLITALIIGATWLTVSTAVGNDLFENRRDEVLANAAQATQAAQRLLDASDAADRATLTSLMVSTRATIRDAASSPQVLVRRTLGQPASSEAPLDFTTDAGLASVITAELADAVASGEQPQYWQSVQFVDENQNTQAGIVVGSLLVFPGGVGTYSLFIGYGLSEAEQTLAFVQQILLITSLLLMVLIGVLVFSVVRFVFRPIRVAADTSHRLAEGEEDVRMPALGDNQFDVLAANFNEMADALQSRIGELDTLSTMQQRFVSDVSHELRTPLTTIRLAGDVLYNKRDEFTPAASRSAELLHTQVLRFESLLEDLLEISRYDAGSVAASLEPCNMVELVNECVEGLRALSPSPIEARSLGGFVTIEVDARRIRRIITNLLGNAIAHGEEQPITVTIDSNASALAISIRDLGVGMTREQTAHAFERFWRADTSRTRGLGGTGLGLAIALEDAQLHQGALEVWSLPGQGAHFLLTLPREPGMLARAPIARVPEDARAEDARAEDAAPEGGAAQ
jgi:two-component system sensor histidine kinase MtrB